MVSGKKFRESVENQIYPLFPCQMFRLTEIFCQYIVISVCIVLQCYTKYGIIVPKDVRPLPSF